MNFSSAHVIKKVPGEPTKVKEYALDKDLSKLSRRELLDIKSRQLKLLENKSWLRRLPDKGQKIQDLYERVIEALKLKESVDETSNLLSKLNLESKNISNLEWEGSTKIASKQPVLDSDDDEVDPLQILVETNAEFARKKIIKQEPAEKSLVTDEDIKEAKEVSHLHLDPIIESMCHIDNLEPSKRFLPYKNTKDSGKENSTKVRENSSATPPVTLLHTKLLTLRESYEITSQNQKAMKELQEKQASEKLQAKMKALEVSGVDISKRSQVSVNTISSDIRKYRLPPEEYDDEDMRGSGEDTEDSLSDEYDE